MAFPGSLSVCAQFAIVIAAGWTWLFISHLARLDAVKCVCCDREMPGCPQLLFRKYDVYVCSGIACMDPGIVGHGYIDAPKATSTTTHCARTKHYIGINMMISMDKLSRAGENCTNHHGQRPTFDPTPSSCQRVGPYLEDFANARRVHIHIVHHRCVA